MAGITHHPSHGTHQAKKATLSGWIGSVLDRVTAMLPALFAYVAPPCAANIPLAVGAITFGVTVKADEPVRSPTKAEARWTEPMT